MRLGPTIVITFPQCGHKYQYRNIASGNFNVWLQWSDGYLDTTGCANNPVLVRCHECGRCFCVKDAQKEERVVMIRVAGVDDLPVIDARDYLAALAQGLADDQRREYWLRRESWWRANDPYRELDAIENGGLNVGDRTHDEIENMREILALVDEVDWLKSDDTLLTKAELHREMGDCAACIRLLEDVEDDDSCQIKDAALGGKTAPFILATSMDDRK